VLGWPVRATLALRLVARASEGVETTRGATRVSIQEREHVEQGGLTILFEGSSEESPEETGSLQVHTTLLVHQRDGDDLLDGVVDVDDLGLDLHPVQVDGRYPCRQASSKPTRFGRLAVLCI